MRRRLLLTALALCGLAQAAEQPRIEFTVSPAWKGWARPGRASELDIRLTTDRATRATVEVAAGRQSLRTEVDLQPGRAQRLHLPVGVADGVSVSVAAPDAPTQRREVALSRAESPLLGVALASDEGLRLDGFHPVALAADDLPRHPSAYASVDALVLDAATLAALDPRQVGALLAHAAGCGRIVVVNADARVRRVLDGAGGCGGRALMGAASLAEGMATLESSLAANLPQAVSMGGIGQLARPAHAVWARVAVALAAYAAAMALALLFVASLPALLLMPALAAVAALALLHALPAPSQLIVWSEGESGARMARYQAWQTFPGLVRERVRVPVPSQLATTTQPCLPAQAMRLDHDAQRGRTSFAEFDTRLFRQVALCHSGSFPMTRAPAWQPRAAGARDLRNAGTAAWPAGVLLMGGLVHDLPALAAGAAVPFGERKGRPPHDPVERTALSRTPPDGASALWALDLTGVADAPTGSTGWLLVSVPTP